MTMRVSAVIATHNRLAALRESLPRLLEAEGLDQIVVVVDGSTDGTIEYLESVADSRLTYLRQSQSGVQMARRAGIEAAEGEWLFMIDDDDSIPADHVTRLLKVAIEHDADIVGAPWVTATSGRSLDEEIALQRSRPVDRKRLDDHPRVFPRTEIATPFLYSIALVRRTVFDSVKYDPGYRGNAYREETDFYVSAAERGFKIVLTPATFSFTVGAFSGGHLRSQRLRYEWWAVRNNWRFLWRHRRWLSANEGPYLRLGAQFTVDRSVRAAKAFIRQLRPR